MASSMSIILVNVSFSGSPIIDAHSSSLLSGSPSRLIVCCIVRTIRPRELPTVPSKSSITALMLSLKNFLSFIKNKINISL